MRRWGGSAAIAALGCLALVAAAPARAEAPPQRLGAGAKQGYVRAPGGPFLVDAQGRRLILHGVNLVPKCGARTAPAPTAGHPCVPDPSADEPAYVLEPGATDPGRRFSEAEAATLRSLGFSVVRLGIVWEALEPGPRGSRADEAAYCSPHAPGTPFPNLGLDEPFDRAAEDAYLGKVATTVRLLAAQGIRVILDMHQDAWGSYFFNASSSTPWKAEGAPLWATCTSGRPFLHESRWSEAYFDPAVESALLNFFTNDVRGDLQEQYIRAWVEVARYFSSYRDVIGYELFNEPVDPAVLLPAAGFDRALACFYAGSRYAPLSCAAAGSQAPKSGLIPSLLAADPHHLVFYEPPVTTDYGVPETVGVLERLPFGRLVLSFHDYPAASAASSNGACFGPACGPNEAEAIGLASEERSLTQTAQRGGPAWFMTEFGAERDPRDAGRMAALADAHLLSWTWWAGLQLHDPTGQPSEALIDEDDGQPYPAMAHVLARSYAEAVAGTPVSESFNPATGAFRLVYRSDPRVDAPTEIRVPVAWQYPGGYSVWVRGGRVVSNPGSSVLLVRDLPGDHEVEVEVARRP